nr:MAG TPA_asm: hypothetical protein [Caudoviricetes sp.]
MVDLKGADYEVNGQSLKMRSGFCDIQQHCLWCLVFGLLFLFIIITYW